MRIYLSALGWIGESPVGNRMRWSYPAAHEASSSYLGFPKAIVVERAPLVRHKLPKDDSRGGLIPLEWWDDIGSKTLAGSFPLVERLPTPVQAIRFRYRGPSARVLVLDELEEEPVFDRVLDDGEWVQVESAAIKQLTMFTVAMHLEDLATVDLFRERDLDWTSIARIAVAPTLHAQLQDVEPRHGVPLSITPPEWKDLVDQAREAAASSPASQVEGEPTAWEMFDVLLALRWEHAALFGYGFFDGPHSSFSKLDDINAKSLLESVPQTPMVYRVRDVSDRVQPSNVAVCRPSIAAPLARPSEPVYVSARVRLDAEDSFAATFEVETTQGDSRAIGLRFQEEVGPSPTIGSAEQFDELVLTGYSHRTTSTSRNARSLIVPFHDVTLRARAAAFDGWDRESPFSSWSAPTSLELVHEPAAPPLRSAKHSDETVELARELGGTSVPDWTPDLVLIHSVPRLAIYRQIGTPRVEHVVADEPALISGRLYDVRVPGVDSPNDFEGGSISGAATKFTIESVDADRMLFTVPDGPLGDSLFPAGPVTLRQDPLDLSLWAEVEDVDALALSEVITATDAVPEPTEVSDVLSYHARLQFLGHIGPPSNVVQAMRFPTPPTVPLPFTVALLGLDFYDRTMIKVAFTSPQDEGRYSIWWADGVVPESDFENEAVPGEYGEQSVHQAHFLFDVLSLPVPVNVDRTVTIGVQRVNAGGGQSGFKTATVLLAGAG